jgi:hypothetical protein
MEFILPDKKITKRSVKICIQEIPIGIFEIKGFGKWFIDSMNHSTFLILKNNFGLRWSFLLIKFLVFEFYQLSFIQRLLNSSGHLIIIIITH